MKGSLDRLPRDVAEFHPAKETSSVRNTDLPGGVRIAATPCLNPRHDKYMTEQERFLPWDAFA
jgi:hypothetical protein